MRTADLSAELFQHLRATPGLEDETETFDAVSSLWQVGVAFPFANNSLMWLDLKRLFHAILPEFFNHDQTSLCGIVQRQSGLSVFSVSLLIARSLFLYAILAFKYLKFDNGSRFICQRNIDDAPFPRSEVTANERMHVLPLLKELHLAVEVEAAAVPVALRRMYPQQDKWFAITALSPAEKPKAVEEIEKAERMLTYGERVFVKCVFIIMPLTPVFYPAPSFSHPSQAEQQQSDGSTSTMRTRSRSHRQ